jgi:hypothetical protein
MRLIHLLLLLIAACRVLGASPEELAQRDRCAKIEAVDKPFDQLSHREISKAGQTALRIDASKWKHAESEHFIIHYQLSDVKNRLIREAEYYYWKIQNDLKLTTDLVEHKSHIFLFQDDDEWRGFQVATGLSNIAGVTMGHEFFSYYPKKKDKDFSGTVAHEMTHLVFNRFFTGRPPLWLNEGFAEFQAHNAFQSLYGKRLGAINKDSTQVGDIHFVTMTTWTQYPPTMGNIQAFYVKAQLAVGLLIDKGGPERFVQFVNTSIQDPDFYKAFNQHYREVFKDIDKFLKELARKEKKL